MKQYNPNTLFKNKIETLLYLKDKLCKSIVLDMVPFSVEEYLRDPDNIYSIISTSFDKDDVIIRSSASTEDQTSTNAGHFTSVLDVCTQNKDAVFSAINQVVESYRRDNLPNSEMIFVQKQIKSARMAGVALSFEPDYGRPYFYINYDLSGSTNSVTGGKCKKWMYISRDFNWSECLESRLCSALIEVEEVCNSNYLNIEFAITENNEVVIFQARHFKLANIHKDLSEVLKRKNELKASYISMRKILSDMAFWNPSEIIGDAPHPLDYSLYELLVTECAWNDGIAELGYFQTESVLMTKIGIKPYVDLNVAFMALTPSSVSQITREKIVKFYTDQLLCNKNLHDKIEFSICFTCYDFRTLERLHNVPSEVMGDCEIRELIESLRSTTKAIVKDYNNFLSEDLRLLGILEAKLAEYEKSHKGDIVNMGLELKNLLVAIRDYGIVPFARQARCAFIGMSFCLSAVESGYVSSEQIEAFMFNLNTITQEMRADLLLYMQGAITKDSFIKTYGHLRANSFNILSEKYSDIGIERIFGDADAYQKKQEHEETYGEFSLKLPDFDFDLKNFVREAICNREYFKFVFSKALSYSLDLIARIGNEFGLSREEISYLDINDVFELSLKETGSQTVLEDVFRNRNEYNLNAQIVLPSVISEENDFEVICMDESDPNFVTNHVVTGETLVLDMQNSEIHDIDGKIIIIQNADPGSDWIFTKGRIAGLITKYGGLASHMSIRCMEYNIPAAIGCGEVIFNQVRQCRALTLDCLRKKVSPL